jgi:hypothetical protein
MKHLRLAVPTIDAVYIPEVDMQRKLQAKTNKYGNKFTGVDIKVAVLVDMIKKYFGKDILYVDSACYVRSLPHYEQHVDMLFLSENHRNVNNGVNIGVIGLKCNERTLRFWERVLSYVRDDGLWDQGIVNIMLGTGSDTIFVKKYGDLYKHDDHDHEFGVISWGVFQSHVVSKNTPEGCVVKFTGTMREKQTRLSTLLKA